MDLREPGAETAVGMVPTERAVPPGIKLHVVAEKPQQAHQSPRETKSRPETRRAVRLSATTTPAQLQRKQLIPTKARSNSPKSTQGV